jgi:hypothetical protein
MSTSPPGPPFKGLPRGRVLMDDVATLSHTTWDCKYYVVFIPKYRRKALYRARTCARTGGGMAFCGAMAIY